MGPPLPPPPDQDSLSDEEEDVVLPSRLNQQARQPGGQAKGQRLNNRSGTVQHNNGTTGNRPGEVAKKKKPIVGKSWETSLQVERDKAQQEVQSVVNVEAQIELRKRQRLRSDTQSFQRGIIRHVVLVIDMTAVMAEKDMLPNRFLTQLRYCDTFIQEFFEQNPISQLAILGMHDGVTVTISELSGNPDEHTMNLRAVRAGTILSSATTAPITVKIVRREPKGSPSLQNALELVRAILYHTPTHGTREAVIILGALLSVDPGDIHQTIDACERDRIRVNIIGMSARLRICTEICSRTNSGDSESTYTVAMDAFDLKELLMKTTTPPLIRTGIRGEDGAKKIEPEATALLLMGFPLKTGINHGSSGTTTVSGTDESSTAVAPTMCACHGHLSREGYVCPRCYAKVCSLPVGCPSCGLTLVLSTHLARSYHHLFPLPNYVAVDWMRALDRGVRKCMSCLQPLPDPSPDVLQEWGRWKKEKREKREKEKKKEGDDGAGIVVDGEGDVDMGGSVLATATAAQQQQKKRPRKDEEEAQLVGSESSRYECKSCKSHFCVDCDLFCHQVLHNCPGCLGIATGSGAEWGPSSWKEMDGSGTTTITAAKEL